MNNDFLAGILSGQTGPVPPLQNGRNKNNNIETGDFVSILRNRLAFDADKTTGSTQSTTNFAFRAKSSAGEINPLLISGAETRFPERNKPTVEIKSEKRLENDARSEATANRKAEETRGNKDDNELKADSTRESDHTDEVSKDEAPKAEEQAETAEKAAEAGLVSQEQLAALQAMIEKFDPEQQQQLVEALEQMSPQDLLALAEAPEEFKQALLELTAEMPDSDEKQELLSLLNGEEFSEMLKQLSEEIRLAIAEDGTGSENSSEVPVAVEMMQTIGEAVANDKAVDKTSTEHHQAAVAQKVKSAESAVAEEAETADASGPAEEGSSTETEAVVETDSEVKTKAGKNQEKAEVSEKNEQKLQARLESDKTGEHGSLRQEFKKLNQTAQESAQSSQSDEAQAPGQAPTTGQNTSAQQPAVQTELRQAIEEAARRFLSAMNGKSSEGNAKTESHGHVYTADSVRKPVQASNSSGNSGMNNGFAFQSGSTSNQNSVNKAAAPLPLNTTNFAELMEKAEFVKTKDGAKILNLELAQKELGKVEMELTSKDGAVTARLSAENSVAKAKLDELAPQIKEQLLGQGVNLSEITVDISSRNPDEGNRNQMSGGKGKSGRIDASRNRQDAEAIIKKNVLPNLRRAALNIQAVDMMV
ncbi:MAG TPA: flagellar hook-length control protein FliK [Candidatus Rifleibacterium sp.]|nr:flagellar hook-length control protein FliK [Candidatus Rifleibacterium sp.]